MSLLGLPDFQQPLHTGNIQIFYSYESAGNYTLLPEKLEIASGLDGSPDFLLEFVRGKNPMLPPEPYSLLDFRVSPHYQMTEGLIFLRNQQPAASLSVSSFSSGFLRFQPLGNLNHELDELTQPIPLVWNGLGMARFSRKLSPSTGILLKNSLQSQVLALTARAELEMIGVSPRVPVKVRFDPKQLLESLVSLGTAERQVSWQAIADSFRHNWQFLPLQVEGDLDEHQLEDFAQTLTDRVRLRFGKFVPAPTIDAGAHIALVSPTSIGSGRFEWDLAQPISVLRPLTFDLNPQEGESLLNVVVREKVVPPIPTGFQTINLVANLPSHREGILDLGVTLRVKAKPPLRPQTQVETVELNTDETPQINLRFSPQEKPEYTFSTYVIIKDAQGIEQLESEAKPYSGNRLYLNPHDFPVDFVTVQSSRLLLEIAMVRGICQRLLGSSLIEDKFELTLNQPTITLALSKSAENATLSIEAESREGLGTIYLNSLPARSLLLDLHSFPEAGPQKVEVECIFENERKLVIFEFLAEGLSETAGASKLLYFTPDKPQGIFTWMGRSPFQCRYRYRRTLLGSSSAQWSDYLSGLSNLKIYV